MAYEETFHYILYGYFTSIQYFVQKESVITEITGVIFFQILTSVMRMHESAWRVAVKTYLDPTGVCVRMALHHHWMGHSVWTWMNVLRQGCVQMANVSTLMAHSSVFVIQVIAWALTGRCVLVSNVQKLSTSIQTGFVYIKFISKLMIQNKTITEHL